MAIVVRRARVIAPNVCFRHLSIWIVAAGRQLRFVSENLTDLENARRRATIAFFLSNAGFILPCKPGAPGKPIFTKQHRKRPRDRRPISATCTFKEPQLAAHGIPRWCNPQNELCAIVWNTICMRMNASRYK